MMKNKLLMMKNKARCIATLLFGVAMISGLLSCSDGIKPEESSQRVIFGATTSYSNLPKTRTIYSGEEFDVSGKAVERIDWVAGDQVFILNATNSQSGVFTVVESAITPDNEKSSTGLTSADEMYWASEANTFLSVYPASAYNPSTGFGGNIPAVQAQSESHVSKVGLHGTNTSETVTNPVMSQHAYMVARKETAKANPVTLEFYPAVTAFEFNMAFADDGGNAPTISKFQFFSSSSALTGDWTWDGEGLADTDFTCPTYLQGVNDTITVNFDNVTINAANPLRFTVFALPQDITDVKVRFFLSTGTKTLSLNKKTTGVFDTFTACKKYRITTPNVAGDWEYVITCTDPSAVAYTGEKGTGYENGTVTSYKHSGDDVEADRVPVRWVVEGYYTDQECSPENRLAAPPYWVTGYDTGDTGMTGSVTPEDIGIDYARSRARDSLETVTPEAEARNALIANHATLGTAASPFNLANPRSVYNGDYIEESANCYIVNACGWYRIPLVMGNGVKNDGLNPDETTYKGYNGNGTDDLRVLFKNYKGESIVNPWLYLNGGTPTSAEIVWEDIEGLVETRKDAMGYNTYDLPEGCISSDGKWLTFHIPTVREGAWIFRRDNSGAAGELLNEPRQGNAVIAVRDAGGDIMWSYHIWVTDYVPKNHDDEERAASADKDVDVSVYWELDPKYKVPIKFHADNIFPYRIMGRVLGHTLYGTTVTRYYPLNTVYVKLRQNDGVSDLTTVMKVTQNEGQEHKTLHRNQPFYAHFRKDAFWPGTGLSGVTTLKDEPVWYGKCPSLRKEDGTPRVLKQKMTIGQTIKNPALMYQRTGTDQNSNWYSGTPVNLWNSEIKVTSKMFSHNDIDKGILYFLDRHLYLLGNKTIYDPCPAGYLVPPADLNMITIPHPLTWSDPPYVGMQSGLAGFKGLAYYDDDSFTMYTDMDHTSTYTLPATGTRAYADDGRFVTKTQLPLAFYGNSLSRTSTAVAPVLVISALYPNNFGFYTLSGGAMAMLPIDDSVGPDPADYPTKEEYEAGLTGGSSLVGE